MWRWPIYAAAVVLGLALCIRPQLLFFAPLLIAAALFPIGDSWPKWLLHCCLTLLVFVAASLPYFLFNMLEFGHPLKTGYDFWVPAWAESDRLFSVRNVPAQLAMLWSEATANWKEFRVANLFGTGTYIAPPFLLLALLGLAFIRVNRFTVSAFLGAVSYFILTLTYAFVDGRFYIPLFLLLIPVAILAAEWAMSNVLNPSSSSTVAGTGGAASQLSWLSFPIRVQAGETSLPGMDPSSMQRQRECRDNMKHKSNLLPPSKMLLGLFCLTRILRT